MTQIEQSCCRWCSRPAERDGVVEREDVARDGTVRRPALTVPVCEEHGAMVDAQWRRVDLEADLRRERRRLERVSNPKTIAAATATVRRLERELEEVRR